MRKLKLQVQMSVDGFVCGPNGEMDWMVWNWDEALKAYVAELTESMDTILLGRKMAGGFIDHWTKVAADPKNPEHAAGKIFTDTPKVVFSKTLKSSPWENTELASGELSAEVERLKQQKGKDLIVYGGASFNASLIQAGLIDEYHLFVNPAAIGTGLSIFRELQATQGLLLLKSQAFDCGIVVLQYVLKQE